MGDFKASKQMCAVKMMSLEGHIVPLYIHHQFFEKEIRKNCTFLGKFMQNLVENSGKNAKFEFRPGQKLEGGEIIERVEKWANFGQKWGGEYSTGGNNRSFTVSSYDEI